MVFTPATVTPTVRLQGPFWQADVEVLQLASPRQNLAFRSLWLEQRATGTAGELLYLPGTAILLGCVRRVTVTPAPGQEYRWQRQAPAPAAETPAEIRTALGTGELSLLLVQVDPNRWPSLSELGSMANPQNLPPTTCLAGDIALDTFLSPVNNATSRLYDALDIEPVADVRLMERRGVTRQRSPLTVHSSGLSLYGCIDLPWEAERLPASLQLAQTFSPSPSNPNAIQPGPFRLSLEVERLIPTEQTAWVDAWRRLSQYLTPRNPLNGLSRAVETTSPHWVTLEITNPTAIPNLFWAIDAWSQGRTLTFASDSFSLIFSNQSPYDLEVPPTSLARVSGTVRIIRQENGPISLNLTAGTEAAATHYAYRYRTAVPDSPATEEINLQDLTLAFDPVQVPQFLRERQGQPVPNRTTTVAPPVLWGFMPLERGWFQLPVPNLTEQRYLDSGLANPLTANRSSSLLQGAVTLGNDNPSLLTADYPHEQPWNLVLTNAAYLTGTWTLTPVGEPSAAPPQGYRLSRVDLNGASPEVILNGLFWLSTARPLAQDALPDLDNWVAGVKAHVLRTVRQTDLFPPVVVFNLAELALSARVLPPISPSEPKPVVAALGAWRFSYAVDEQVLGDFINAEVLPPNTFSQYLPWVWQHHGSLPMVQALPLTQTQVPPSYPSASRQLVPFELGVKTVDLKGRSLAIPEDWQFEATGAGAWPQPITSPALAREWEQLFDLPLVSLSLPGLVMDPRTADTGLAADASLALPSQYRYDLPYTDEPNALAQLPEPPQDPLAVSPLPTSPLPKPPQPLFRDTFADHWQILSQQASLASADAVAAFSLASNGATQIQSLVEPLTWPVQASLDVAAYPGTLTLTNRDGDNGTALRLDGEIHLTGLAALEGISGQFSQNGTPFTLVAGSLMTTRVLDGLRDQRGLLRSATQIATGLLTTPVSLELEPNQVNRYDLTTTLEPLQLRAGDRTWQLWFRDLPIQQVDGQPAAFSRQHTQSAAAEDINDPNAFSRQQNVLNGYEWRLGDAAQSPASFQAEEAFLPFFQLHLYPLTLEAVTLEAGQVQRLQVVGRLQLPLSAEGEALPDLTSDILLDFERDSTGTLVLSAVGPVPDRPATAPAGIWPLALDDNETTDAPQLTWHNLRLHTQADTGEQSLIVEQVWLNFFLFDAAWALPLDEPLVFYPASAAEVTGRYEFPAVTSAPALAPQLAALTLRPFEPFQHSASLQVAVSLGQLAQANATPTATFAALVEFPLVNPPDQAAATWLSGTLLRQLPLELGPLTLNHHALEFEWQRCQFANALLYGLPGMRLQAGDLPGFAALTFTPQPQAQPAGAAQYPTLALRTAYLETILTCQWGKFLQSAAGATATAGEGTLRDLLFAASAGDLVIGYTSQWVPSPDQQPGTWAEALLLNGFLEVKNLISWPLALQSYDEVEDAASLLPAGVVLPALPPLENGSRSLSHLRHTLRVLFNQHSLPVDVLTLGETGLVFQFRGDRPWAFLAVTEHQLVTVLADSAQTYRLGDERRWATTQTVQLMPVGVFKTFLGQSAAKTLDPSRGTTTVGQASLGLWQRDLQTELLTGEDAPLNEAALGSMLMVEASAPHWVRTTPVTAANPTTLQFLPNGSQLGILSNPQDYGPSDPQDPNWLLLTMPFWGRLLNASPELSTSTNPLQRDPIDLLGQGEGGDVALALSHWAKTEPVAFTLAGADTAAGRTWARLEPLSLEESWFRLNHPLPEAQPSRLQSVLAALPSTSARLSRSTALGYAYDPLRRHYPPSVSAALDATATQATATDPASLLVYAERSRQQRRLGSVGDRGLQVLYTFQEGEGNTVYDVSGVGAPLDLRLERGTVAWLPSRNGLAITNQPALLASAGPATKVINTIGDTNALTVEAWVRQGQVIPAPGATVRLITLSERPEQRNFSMGFTEGRRYAFTLRTGNTGADGAGRFVQGGNAQAGQMVHLVYTRDAAGNAVLYINGQAQGRENLPGNLKTSWDSRYRLGLGNELSGGERSWRGEYYLIAIYNQALTANEVTTLWQAGHESRLLPEPPPYGWHQTALQLKTSGLFPSQPADSQPPTLVRHAAATVLPARLTVNGQANPRPLSLAVSPYLGLEFQTAPEPPSGSALAIQVAAVELLCLETATGTLRPVASYLFDRQQLAEDPNALNDLSQQWALETHRRLVPESTIAVLRFREIQAIAPGEVQPGQAPLVTRYRFQVLAVPQPAPLAKPMFALRSDVRQRRSRSGHFGGSAMPLLPHPIELAPPQTTGVQPLYLEPNGNGAGDSNGAGSVTQGWPWGLSGLRLGVQYSALQQPVLGSTPGDTVPLTLWWQAPSYAVQYRSASPAQPELPTAGLPPYYRPGAIKTLLPVLPSLPMPGAASLVSSLGLSIPEAANAEEDSGAPPAWQPILPGHLRYLLTGDRPGVMMVIRNQLLKQVLAANEPLLVSGSVPVQHRVPRPVALPPNTRLDKALQPWASYFEPQRNLLATTAPADEAFFADCGGRPAQRLRLQLQSPVAGAISSTWDGQLVFLTAEDEADWNIQVKLVLGSQTFGYRRANVPVEPATGSTPTTLTYRLPNPEAVTRLRDALASRAVGDLVMVMVEVQPTPQNPAVRDNFWQTLTFPLRMTDPEALPLPLRPTFIHFEDPEYNRQLTSNSSTATATVALPEGEQIVSYDITLACDRREYNPQSTLFLRYDWSDNRPGVTGTLSLAQINAAGIVRPLNWPRTETRPLATRTIPIPSRILEILSLADLQAENQFTLNQGDVLDLTLTLLLPPTAPAIDPIVLTVILPVTIVVAPVIPVPQAAYGLLRGLVHTAEPTRPDQPAQPSAVECVRFAWSPPASRIELICAEDLRTGIVRRRAVFQWSDTTRPTPDPAQQYRYAMQKITQTGSTYQPEFEPVEQHRRF